MVDLDFRLWWKTMEKPKRRLMSRIRYKVIKEISRIQIRSKSKNSLLIKLKQFLQILWKNNLLFHHLKLEVLASQHLSKIMEKRKKNLMSKTKLNKVKIRAFRKFRLQIKLKNKKIHLLMLILMILMIPKQENNLAY